MYIYIKKRGIAQLEFSENQTEQTKNYFKNEEGSNNAFHCISSGIFKSASENIKYLYKNRKY